MENLSLLEALAFAQIPRSALIARLASVLAREVGENLRPRLTKTRIEELCRAIRPPRGAGNKLIADVSAEAERQVQIRREREAPRREFRDWCRRRYSLAGRRNHAYATSFGRPVFVGKYDPPRANPHPMQTQEHRDWERKDESLDWGDYCRVFFIWRRTYLVAVTGQDELGGHVALRVRHPDGKVTVSWLNNGITHVGRIAEALGCLADKEVEHAWAHGLRVEPDYARRVFVIHKNGALIERPWVLELRVTVINNEINPRVVHLGNGPIYAYPLIAAVADGDRDVWLPGWDADGAYSLPPSA